MIVVRCDACGSEINHTEQVTVLRMWDIPVHAIEAEGMTHLAYEDNFHLCDRCYEKFIDMLGGGAE